MQDIYVDFDISVFTGYGIDATNADQRWIITGNIATTGSAAIHALGSYSEFDLENRFTVANKATAVELIGDRLTLTNSGIIEGERGIAVTGNGVTINNNHKISGNPNEAIVLKTSPTNTTYINNFADIVAWKVAIATVSGKLHLLNRGHITGDVKLAGGADSITSPGMIAGEVRLGGGRDVFDATDGLVVGTVRGGRGDDVLTGGVTGDRIQGGRGDDVIDGGGGRDVLTGGKGGDTFVFADFHGIDKVKDFDVGQDTIRIDNALLTGLADGPLTASAFHVGKSAADADDRIIYDDRSGMLKYDANGDLAGGLVKIAKLSPGLDLSHHHIEIV